MAKFAVRARAVDLLGRQQIAGIPTALHELFKNAHDAYAKRVEVDYFRAQHQLVLRDDGDGMSPTDFVTKWLTLGTESKVNANNAAQPTSAPRGLKSRKILGEKGIGRLAVAALGPLVLALTRCDPSTSKVDETTVALVHWGLFELPGVDLSAIDIPLVTIQGGTLPDREILASLVAGVAGSISALTSGDEPRRAALLSSLDAIAKLDVIRLANWLAEDAQRNERKDLSLLGDGHGTHFIVAPVDTILDSDIDTKGQWGSSPFQRLLLGFGNSLSGDEAEFAAEFRDHLPDGRVDEHIGKRAFFTPEEFRSVDHHFEGRFDEFGQFTGTIQLYGAEPQNYVLSWPPAAGRPTECGPFSLKLGVLMGLADESRLPRDEHGEMYRKLGQFGGLYIYRDGVRVLPYGNNDFDFVNIEQRRSLKASDWFFSYRRMLGWIDVSHNENAALVEKAGREGFRENRAYRQFRDILENFFKQLAVDYFRKDSDLGDEFRDERQRHVDDAERLKRRENGTRERKRKFGLDLSARLDAIERGEPATAVAALRKQLGDRLSHLGEAEADVASSLLVEMENEFLAELAEIERKLDLARPRGIAPTKGQEAAWTAYEQAMEKIRETVFEPARASIVQSIAEFGKNKGIAVERQRRAVDAMQREKSASLAEVRKLRRDAEQAMTRVEQAVQDIVRAEIGDFQTYVEALLVDLGRMNLDGLADDDAYGRQRELEKSLDARLSQGRALIEGMRDQLVSVATAIVERDDFTETAGALERRNVELEDRLDLYSDLAQAGSAIGIIGHEFANVADGVRKSVRRLKPWADGTPELKVIYDDLNSYFEELDDYLALFAPLSRRRYRRKAKVTGAYIEKYLLEALASRLSEGGVAIEVSDRFRTFSLEGLLSTVLGAALNIVDNAVFWASSMPEGDKRIWLDADDEGWLFSNSGPGIPLRMAERIFEFGVTTKPGGRGMGLAISRDALRRIGLQLELLEAGTESQPTFRIGRPSQSGEAPE